MKVAIVILNWNGKEMMREYLPSVIEHTQNEGVKVIVADNGSTDGSVAMLEKEFPDTPLVVLESNYGFAEGYNKALAQIKADYYLLLNSDVEVKDDNWVEVMLSYMEQHQDVAACQPKIMALKRPDYFEYAGAAGGYIDNYGYPFCRGRILDCVEKDEGQYNQPVDVFWATGAALMVRAQDYWEAGGLDSRFFAHMEEIDFCWRIKAAGKRIVCLPQSKVYHLGGASLNQGNPRKTFLNFRNNLLMLYKNLPDSELKSVLRMRAWLDFLAAVHFLVKFDWANFKAVFKAKREFKRMKAEMADDRKRNLQRTVVGRPKERMGFSVLWQFYFRRRKKFSQMPL